MATEQEIMDELLASYGGNEMRAYTPGPFEQQEQTIESFLSGIGQFAGEKEIPFLKALADPAYARNVAGNLSFGTEMTPGVGDVQAIREGAFMMGEDQPLMGSAFIAGSLFTGMSSAQLKKALEKLKKELNEKIPALRARSQSLWRSYGETGNRADEFDAARLARQADRSETRIKREMGEAEELLKQEEFHLEIDKGRESLAEFVEGFEKFKKETGREKLATISDLSFERMVKKFKDENPGVRVSRESRTADQIGKEYDKMFERGEYEILDPKKGKWGTNPEFAKTQDFNIQFNDGTYSKYPLETPKPDMFDRLAEKNPGFRKMLEEGRKDPGRAPYIKPVPPLRKAATETPEPKGIINATPEIRKLYDDMQRGWLKDKTPPHRQLRKEMSEQDSLINKFLEDEADLDERNQLVQMLLDMKNKKPK